MVTPSQIITVKLSCSAMNIIRINASKAQIGGKSHIRSRQERQQFLATDQLVGQACEYAGSIYLFRSPAPYLATREIRNANPRKGDRGEDYLRTNIDVKGSKMSRKPNPWDYNLLVRDPETRKREVYILAIADRNIEDSSRLPTVWLVGWATNDMLPSTPCESGPLRGAYLIPGTELNPLPLDSKQLISQPEFTGLQLLHDSLQKLRDRGIKVTLNAQKKKQI